MQINGNIYREIRTWENVRSSQQKHLSELREYELEGKTEIVNPDPFQDLYQFTLEEHINSLKNSIDMGRGFLSDIAKKVLSDGIDVEHIVTDGFETFKQILPIHNYEIVRSKNNHADYTYTLRDYNSRKFISDHSSWLEALEEVSNLEKHFRTIDVNSYLNEVEYL